MKKFGKILLLLVAVLTLVGCQGDESSNNGKDAPKDNEVTKKCTIINDQQSTSGYKVESSVTIYSKDNIVTKVKTVETVTASQKEILSYFEQTLNNQYEATNESYGGYTYEIKTTDEKLTSNVEIDYTKMNLEQYVKDNAVMKDYVNDKNELTVDGITQLYEAMGATCEK